MREQYRPYYEHLHEQLEAAIRECCDICDKPRRSPRCGKGDTDPGKECCCPIMAAAKRAEREIRSDLEEYGPGGMHPSGA